MPRNWKTLATVVLLASGCAPTSLPPANESAPIVIVGAKLIDGFWRWKPDLTPLREVVMRRSGATADWRVCVERRCRTLDELLPADADPVTMKPCA